MNNFSEWLSTVFQNEWIRRLSILVVTTVVVFLVVRLIKRTVLRHIEEYDDRYKVVKAANFIKYSLFMLIALVIFNDKLGNIGVTLGVASAGIAFALQEVIVSIAGWLNIITSRQVKVGQRVQIGDIKGDIIDIGILKTTLMEIGGWVDGDLYNGRITEISNNFVFSTPIRNYSEHYPFLWDEITIPISLESDFRRAKQQFVAVVEEICGDFADASKGNWEEMQGKFLLENASVRPAVTLTFDEKWITFTLRYVVDFERRRTTKDRLYTRTLEIIQNEANIALAKPV